VTSLKYQENYLKRLRESIARGPLAKQVLPLLDLFDGIAIAQRFEMVMELERVLRDVDPALVDWDKGRDLLRDAIARSKDPADFRDRLRALAGPSGK
jgi:hypothetical protein